jgi:hypothetical protein
MASGKDCGMKTKKMKAGGVTSADQKKYGRNMARVMNQRGSKKGGKG